MARADGSVIIDTKLNTAGFSTGAANLKTQFSGLTKAAGKLGAVIAAAFSVRAIVNFGKEAMELGSDLQEVQNVVDVTFTTMSDRVNEFAENAMKTAGLSETMAKRYVGTFGAMAKSFSFTEEEAFNMSTALTQMAGDVASFYNITQDEAYTKLKSVFTGETESLKDLGVVMTQTALDDYAMRKGLKKTTSQMSEQEKVALRYQFVLDQLSTASGDFIRTQDGWANQTRILKLQVDQLKATIGQGLINALTPAIKVINELVLRLRDAAEAFRDFTAAIFGDAGGASSAIGSAADSTEDLGDAIEEAGKKAKKALAPFDEIIRIGEAVAGVENGNATGAGSSTTITAPVIGGSSEEITEDTLAPGLSDAVDGIMEKLEPLQNIDFSNLQGSVSGLQEAFSDFAKVISGKAETAYKNVLLPLSKWTIEEGAPKSVDALSNSFRAVSALIDDLDFQPATDSVSGLMGAFVSLTDTLSTEFSWAWDDIFVPLSKWVIEEGAPASVDALRSAFETLETAVKPVSDGMETLWEEAKPFVEWAGDKGSELLGEMETKFNDLGVAIEEANPDIVDAFEEIGTAIGNMWVAAEPILEDMYETSENVAGINFEGLTDQVGIAAEKFSGLATIIAGITENDLGKAWGGLQDALSACKEETDNLWKSLGDVAEALGIIGKDKSMDALKSSVKNAAGSMNIFRDASKGAVGGVKSMADTAQKASEALASARSEAKSLWEYMQSVWSSSGFAKIKEWIDSLISSSNFSGAASGAISGALAVPTALSLPHLASGTVIPPRAPFMAVLGDQKNGTNIEAPLSTIEDALENVLARRGSMNDQQVVALLQSILEAVYGIQIGDDAIAAAVNRHNRKMNVARGGA